MGGLWGRKADLADSRQVSFRFRRAKNGGISSIAIFALFTIDQLSAIWAKCGRYLGAPVEVTKR